MSKSKEVVVNSKKSEKDFDIIIANAVAEFDIKLTQNDIVDTIAVEYEDKLRNEKKKLNNKYEALKKELSNAFNELKKKSENVLYNKNKQLFTNFEELVKVLDKIYGKKSGSSVSLKPYFSHGIMNAENLIKYLRNEVQIEVYFNIHITSSDPNLTYSNIINGIRFKGNFITLNKNKTLKPIVDKIIALNDEIEQIVVDLSDVSEQLSEMSFNIRKIKAKLTQKLLASNSKTKLLLTDLKEEK